MWHLYHVYFSYFPPQATPSFSMFLFTNEKIDFHEKLLQCKCLTNNHDCVTPAVLQHLYHSVVTKINYIFG